MVRAMKSTGPPGGKATSNRVTLVCAQTAEFKLSQANRAQAAQRFMQLNVIKVSNRFGLSHHASASG
jgi:hypothetical protein